MSRSRMPGATEEEQTGGEEALFYTRLGKCPHNLQKVYTKTVFVLG